MHNYHYLSHFILLILTICSAFPSFALAQKNPFQLNLIKNLEYRMPGEGSTELIKLSNGHYEIGHIEDEGGMSFKDLKKYGVGDLNKDGLDDAIVILASNYGGTGVDLSLHAIINKNGKLENISSIYLDLADVKGISIKSGIIVLNGLTWKNGDDHCCPSQKVLKKYILMKNKLKSK